jgi:hypothetical protein
MAAPPCARPPEAQPLRDERSSPTLFRQQSLTMGYDLITYGVKFFFHFR